MPHFMYITYATFHVYYVCHLSCIFRMPPFMYIPYATFHVHYVCHLSCILRMSPPCNLQYEIFITTFFLTIFHEFQCQPPCPLSSIVIVQVHILSRGPFSSSGRFCISDLSNIFSFYSELSFTHCRLDGLVVALPQLYQRKKRLNKEFLLPSSRTRSRRWAFGDSFLHSPKAVVCDV